MNARRAMRSSTPIREPEKQSLDPALMTRRDALLEVGALLGAAAFVGHAALLSGCVADGSLRGADAGRDFSPDELGWLAEVADTILPETDTPGAKAAGVGPFIALMVRDTYTADEQAIFRAGMQTLEGACMAMHGVGFMRAGVTERTALLERIDAEQVAYMRERARDLPVHYFRMIKQLTLLGYFTSEIGYTQALRYRETPGSFEPCVPYTLGEKSWAPHA